MPLKLSIKLYDSVNKREDALVRRARGAHSPGGFPGEKRRYFACMLSGGFSGLRLLRGRSGVGGLQGFVNGAAVRHGYVNVFRLPAAVRGHSPG
jgi:hypothetical protein